VLVICVEEQLAPARNVRAKRPATRRDLRFTFAFMIRLLATAMKRAAQ
jgi:hypothetical protein